MAGDATSSSNATGNDKSAVDALFSFSDSLGAQYSGEWVYPHRYRVTILDPAGNEVRIGVTVVTIVSENIRNAAGDALTSNNQSVVIRGDTGVLSEPAISRFTVVVAANETNYTDGDTMVLHMDMETNLGGGAQVGHGGKAYVDHLFGFSAVLGAEYSGSWEPGESSACSDGGQTTLHKCFVITLLDTRGGAAVSAETIAVPSIHIRSSSGMSARASNRLTGDRGRRLEPLLVDFIAADADNSQVGLSTDDTLTLVFDRPTNIAVEPPQPWGSGIGEGKTMGDRAYVDSLFRFCRISCPDDSETSSNWLLEASAVRVGDAYSGAWSDESTFVIQILSEMNSDIAIGETVAQPRNASGEHRQVRFRGGISDFSNATSPALRGNFGVGDAPTIAAFVARDVDHADTAYGAFDTYELHFSMPTDRGELAVTAGDKRWVDRYFDFSCDLGLDYSGSWDDPQVAIITVLDGTVGYNPASLAANQLATLRATPSREALFRNKPGTSAPTASAVVSAEPPLRGGYFPNNGGTRLCAGASNCDFGDFAAPKLTKAYVGDLDNSGSWTENDQLILSFDRATNRLGSEGGPMDRTRFFQIFEIRAVNNVGSLDASGTEWMLADDLRAEWVDATTLVVVPLAINYTQPNQAMPDPTQCGLMDADGETIPCPSQRAMGGTTGAAQGGRFNIPAGQGFRMRITINETAGLRAESNSPLAAAASGSVNIGMGHCYAGPLVQSASIRDVDDLDSVYGNGDEVTVRFTVETTQPAVSTKWDIDKLLTFCTACNPGCERDRLREGFPVDAEYNGLGTEYSGYWQDAFTLIITILNSTLPNEGECAANDGGNALMPFSPNSWFVTTSYSASQAPMVVCYGGAEVRECQYGRPSGLTTTDQFGNSGLDPYGRMLGPRYPHRWTTEGCEDYLTFWINYQSVPPVVARTAISGSVGPVGTPQIDRFIADDPDDLDLVYSSGDTVSIIFDK